MNYLNRCSLVLFGASLFSGQVYAQKKSVVKVEYLVVKGHVNGDTKGFNKVYVYGTDIKNDSVVISNGKFKFKIPYHKGIGPLFYAEYSSKVDHYFTPLPAVVDRCGVLDLNAIDITKGLNSGKWSGIQSAQDFQEISDKMTAISMDVDKIMHAKYADRNELIDGPAYGIEKDSLLHTRSAVALEGFIKTHADSYAAPITLANFGTMFLATDDLEKILGMLSARNRDSEAAKGLLTYIAGVKRSAVGNYVEDFSLNTAEEKEFSLSSLKGKYVLIDFWASWCGPCKASFPQMKELYRKYKSDKFEIYSISIDRDKDAWLKELKAQELPWIATLDTKSVSQHAFAITGVPTTYLIDPQGKIVFKEIGFEPGANGPVEKKLVELFGSK